MVSASACACSIVMVMLQHLPVATLLLRLDMNGRSRFLVLHTVIQVQSTVESAATVFRAPGALNQRHLRAETRSPMGWSSGQLALCAMGT